jgi:hypothetical protein
MLRRNQFVIWFTGLSLTAAIAAEQPAPPLAEPPAGAQVSVQSAAEDSSSAGSEQQAVQPKIAPLLLLVLSGVASEFGKRVGSGAGKEFVDENPGLFTNLMKRLGWKGNSGKTDKTAADESSLAPAVGYSLQKLDPGSFAVAAELEVGDEPTVLKTGDVFAIQYSTNLPGQIRLENVDPAGRVSNLGTYTVLVDQLNRLPRERGIRLEGEPGVELLKLYFYPCLPPESAGQPRSVRFESQLPNCGRAPNTLYAAATGTVQTRTLVNLEQPEPTMAFAGLPGYQTNEVALAIVQIKHERPSDGK